MSRLTFARSAGAAGPKIDGRTIYIYIYRQTDGALNSKGGTRSRSPQLLGECCALWGERELSGRVLARAGIGRAELAVR